MTLVMTPINNTQRDLLLHLARELNIKAEVLDEEDIAVKGLMQLSQISFANEWNSEEDAHWDKFVKQSEDVPKR